jgi:hypothetical protein
VRALHFADADDDLVPDLAIAIAGAPMHLLVARGTKLEDQTPVRLPQPAPIANAVALGSWDGGCFTDAIIASGGESVVTSGDANGTLNPVAMAPAATDVVMVDLDDDGDLDTLLATDGGVVWLAR